MKRWKKNLLACIIVCLLAQSALMLSPSAQLDSDVPDGMSSQESSQSSTSSQEDGELDGDQQSSTQDDEEGEIITATEEAPEDAPPEAAGEQPPAEESSTASTPPPAPPASSSSSSSSGSNSSSGASEQAQDSGEFASFRDTIKKVQRLLSDGNDQVMDLSTRLRESEAAVERLQDRYNTVVEQAADTKTSKSAKAQQQLLQSAQELSEEVDEALQGAQALTKQLEKHRSRMISAVEQADELLLLLEDVEDEENEEFQALLEEVTALHGRTEEAYEQSRVLVGNTSTVEDTATEMSDELNEILQGTQSRLNAIAARKKRNGTIIGICVGLVVLFGAGVGYVVLRRRKMMLRKRRLKGRGNGQQRKSAPPQESGSSAESDPRTAEGTGLYQVGAYSHIGTRKQQQDAYYLSDTTADSTRLFAALCDGMGGMDHGERASRMTVEAMVRGFHDGFTGVDVTSYLEQEAHRVDRLVHEEFLREGVEAGTTVVSVVLEGNRLHWLSVGDSRLYIMRKSQMVQVTQDHNVRLLLSQKLESGEMTQDEANAQENKNALISFIGMGDLHLMDLNRSAFLLEPGDLLLLCSDGLSKSLSPSQIQRYLTDLGDNPGQCAQVLADKAYEHRKNNRQDNTTVIVIRYNG